MSELRGTKALEFWCQRTTKGYNNVKIENMTTSWRDGLGFCALIHFYRPDLIDFDQLKKTDIYYNNDLAFTTAAKYLGIPPLLDAEDMVANAVPDRLSVLTYLSQFYHVLTRKAAREQNGENSSPLKYTRPKIEKVEESSIFVELSPQPQIGQKVAGVRRDSCQKCQFPVFLAERVFIEKHVYHRTCLKCKQCSVQLSPNILFDDIQNMYCSDKCLNANNQHLNRTEHEHETISNDTDNLQELQRIEIVSKVRTQINEEDESSLEKERTNESSFIPHDIKLSSCDSIDNIDALSNKSTDSSIKEGLETVPNPTTPSIEETNLQIPEEPTLEGEDKNNENNDKKKTESLDLEDTDVPSLQPEHSVTTSKERLDCVEDKVEVKSVKESSGNNLNPFTDSDDDEHTSDDQQEISVETMQTHVKIKSKSDISYNPFDSSDDEIELAKPLYQSHEEKLTLDRAPNPSTLQTLKAQFDEHNAEVKMSSPRSNSPASNDSRNKSHKKHLKYNKRPAPAPPKPERLNASTSKTINEKDKALLIGQDSEQVPELRSSAKRRLIPLDQSLLAQDNLELNSHSEHQNQQSTYKDSDDYYRRMLMPPALDSPKFDLDPIAHFAHTPEKLQNNAMDNHNDSIISGVDMNVSGQSYPDNKSSHGKWKHRKGPAPAIPITPRKALQMIPLQEIRHELEIIEVQQQGLEKQGVVLERMIRERCEGSGKDVQTTGDLSSTLTAVTSEASTKNCKEVEDLILQLFELVNEKNELFRRQAELTHIRRQQRLEQEHADIESEIRILISQPERNKTDSDKLREETLIARLVEIVELRNKVIDCLEIDRLREAEEDLSIKQSLELYNAGRDSSAPKASGEKASKKEKRGVKDVHKLIKYKSLLRRSGKSE
ncbi:MICAL-like protein 1 isoform X2 [Drosophila grimshawi]|nr:MICAL-like protein 1 isoform X2 [Drosophila grimshawi]